MSDLVGNPEDRFSHEAAHLQCFRDFDSLMVIPDSVI